MLVVEQNANVSLSIADRGYVLSTGRVVLEGKAADLLRGRGAPQGIPGALMGVVSAEGQSRLSGAPSSRSRRCTSDGGRGGARSATQGTTSSSSSFAGSGTLGERRLRRGHGGAPRSRARRRLVEAPGDGISLVRVTLGADTDLHAPMGPRERIVEMSAVEPGKATGSRSFQILFGPHNGSPRATMFVGYVPPGKAPWHYHLYDEIVWIWRAPGRYHLGDEVEPLEDGCCLPDHAARGAHRREHEHRPRARDPRHLHPGREPVRRVPDAGGVGVLRVRRSA